MTKIASYDEARALFSTARNANNGKPLTRWSRLYKSGDNYQIRLHDPYEPHLIATIYPDNTMTFDLPSQILRAYSQTLVGALHRVIPINLERLGKGRYGAAHHKEARDKFAQGMGMRDFYHEVFVGIKFDLITGACLNPVPSSYNNVDPERRKEWLRALRTFKRGMKVRAKIGVLDVICAEVAQERQTTRSWRKPDWFNYEWVDILYNSIKNEQYSKELLVGFVQTADVSYWRHEAPTPAKALDAVDVVCSDLSVELRRRFGVFGE